MNRNLIKVLAILILSLSVTVIHTTAQQPQTDSANASREIQAARTGDELEICNQRLVKTLDTLEAAENALKAVQKENESRKDLALIQEGIIKGQQDLIKILEKQSKKKLSLFFGLVKITY